MQTGRSQSGAKIRRLSNDGFGKGVGLAISDSRMLLFLKDPEKVKSERLATLAEVRSNGVALHRELDQNDFDATVGTEADHRIARTTDAPVDCVERFDRGQHTICQR